MNWKHWIVNVGKDNVIDKNQKKYQDIMMSLKPSD